MAEPALIPGEQELLRVNRHPVTLLARSWKALIGAALVVALIVLLPLTGHAADLKVFGMLATLLLLVIYLDLVYIQWRSETVHVTNQRVILNRGVIRRFNRSLPLDKIQEISTAEGILGRILGYGTVQIESAGRDGAEVLDHVPDPDGFRNLVFEQSTTPPGNPGQLQVTLRYLTAGESHGPRLVVIVDGLPAGLRIKTADINRDLRRRQGGYGRGGRQQIENDQVEIVGGVRLGRTLGSPVGLQVTNRDFENWEKTMSPQPTGFAPTPVTRVRPGHADLAGALKFGFDDVRNVLERASARETTSRVAAGGLAKQLLANFGIEVRSYVRRIGNVEARVGDDIDWDAVEASRVRTPDPGAEVRMIRAIDRARKEGDTLGGVFTVVATGVPVGLGSYTQWDQRLDGLLGQALLSVPAVKATEIGAGVSAAGLPGSQVHDQPRYRKDRGFYHLTNRQGGLTGGVTDGMPVVVSGYLKPISTLRKPLTSVDLRTRKEIQAHYERSDICVVPAGGVIGEAVVAIVLAQALQAKTGGDSLREMRRNLAAYLRSVR